MLSYLKNIGKNKRKINRVKRNDSDGVRKGNTVLPDKVMLSMYLKEFGGKSL